jgi:hypothetical protein
VAAAGVRGRASVGHWHAGSGGTVPGGAVQAGFEKKSNSNGSKHFQTVSNFGQLEKYFPLLKKLK